MSLAPLHVVGGNGPQAPLQIKLAPCRKPNLLAAYTRQDEQFERETAKSWLLSHSGDEGRNRGVRHRLAILPRLHLPGQSAPRLPDRKRVVSGKSVSVRVDLGGRRIIQKTTTRQPHSHRNASKTKPRMNRQ